MLFESNVGRRVDICLTKTKYKSLYCINNGPVVVIIIIVVVVIVIVVIVIVVIVIVIVVIVIVMTMMTAMTEQTHPYLVLQYTDEALLGDYL